MTPTDNRDRVYGDPAMKTSGILVLLLGIWLFISPWVYGAYTTQNAFNSWIVGFVIAVFSAIQLNNMMGLRVLSWINCLLGIWVFFSPWIYGYTPNTDRFVNSLCVGILVFFLALYNATHVAHPHQPHLPMPRTM